LSEESKTEENTKILFHYHQITMTMACTIKCAVCNFLLTLEDPVAADRLRLHLHNVCAYVMQQWTNPRRFVHLVRAQRWLHRRKLDSKDADDARVLSEATMNKRHWYEGHAFQIAPTNNSKMAIMPSPQAYETKVEF
jgi:hypothetical protein